MANAPLADKVGGSTAPTGATINTLVSLAGKIKATEAEASAAPADIYVERGVAKVTMATPTVTEVEGSYTDATSSTKVPIAVTSWALDNTNKSTYLVRSTEGFSSWLGLATKEASVANPYRFVGSNAVAPGLYRTYLQKILILMMQEMLQQLSIRLQIQITAQSLVMTTLNIVLKIHLM